MGLIIATLQHLDSVQLQPIMKICRDKGIIQGGNPFFIRKNSISKFFDIGEPSFASFAIKNICQTNFYTFLIFHLTNSPANR